MLKLFQPYNHLTQLLIIWLNFEDNTIILFILFLLFIQINRNSADTMYGNKMIQAISFKKNVTRQDIILND